MRSRLTVFEMVMLGLVRNLGWRVSDEVLEKGRPHASPLHIERHADDPMASLSDGQKQLVFMAQAFVSDSKALLLDEPTSALDLRHQLIVMEAARAARPATGRSSPRSCTTSFLRPVRRWLLMIARGGARLGDAEG